MKSRFIAIIMLISICLVISASGTKAQTGDEESVSPTHEMPKADNCSIIMMNIRQLAATKHGIVKARARLEPPARTDSMTDEQYEQETNEYEKKLVQLDEQVEELQAQIDEKEQQLASCLQVGNGQVQK